MSQLVNRLPQLAAPWYVHPADDPRSWSRLIEGTDLTFAVVNAANGPSSNDAAYQNVLGQRSSTPLVGYVNLDYGHRPTAKILEDVRFWLDYAAVSGIMLDCVPVTISEGFWNLSLIKHIRQMGAQMVVANPGTPPPRDLIMEADITCIAEYDWTVFQSWQPPDYLRSVEPGRLWMLIHDVPVELQGEAMQMISDKGAGLGWVTAGSLPNPWATLAAKW